jgi:protein-S-isoprenylcysteine O-methyltransferase Ste14
LDSAPTNTAEDPRPAHGAQHRANTLNISATARTAGRHAVARRAWHVTTSLVVRNLLFTLVVPGLGAVALPWWILARGGAAHATTQGYAAGVIAAGGALYLACVWAFAVVGRGTPGPWDPPRHFVAVDPYRWVRNPIYVSALLVVLGEAWLFGSRSLLIYAGVMAIVFHLFVVGYEEPALRRAFGQTYLEYTERVRRWLPMPVQHT